MLSISPLNFRTSLALLTIAVCLQLASAFEVQEHAHNFKTIGNFIEFCKSQEQSAPKPSDLPAPLSIRRPLIAALVSSQGSSEAPAESDPATLRSMFEQFKKTYNKTFSHMEDIFRFQVFKSNLKKIDEHNRQNTSFKMAITEFSVLTDEEFETEMLNPPTSIEIGPTANVAAHGRLLQDGKGIEQILAKLPAEVDWTLKRKVTDVKHQQQCQGCYVFSAVAALESAVLIQHNTTIKLSEQEIIDCSRDFHNNGCVGGQPSYVYDYILSRGINLVDNYPYSGTEATCKAPTMKGIFKRLKSYLFPEKNVISLIQYLQYGPVAVNHYVPDDFKYYSSGIFDTADCHHSTTINHSSLLVGYNFNSNPPYFMLKNSWGNRWGEVGFYKVKVGPLDLRNPGFCYLANNGYNVFPIVY